MKKIIYATFVLLALVSCKKNEEVKVEQKPVSYAEFGDKINDQGAISKEELFEKYKAMKETDTLEVKVASKIVDVCQKKGCWMNLDMGEEQAMVRFKDYGFFMPKDITGQEIIVNGKAFVEEMSVEDQRHYAEDGGKTKAEIAAITMPKRTLAFVANGVLIPEVENQ